MEGCSVHCEREWRVVLYIVISNKGHRQIYLYIDTMNIVFTFLYAGFYNGTHTVGILKRKRVS